MNQPDATALALRDFVAELVSAGITTAFVSPGSRNTPVTLALATHPDIADVSIRDERSAGFMALGFAKATGTPALVVCTSGSAATHYFPSVVEADQSATPMIVVTADRPIRLRGTFSPQTMDQSDLYGSHVKASLDLDVGVIGLPGTASAVVSTAVDGIPGPVHINIPLDEPLTPDAIPPAARIESSGRTASESSAPRLGLRDGQRVLIISGGFLGSGFPPQLGAFAEQLGAPLLADPQARPASGSTIVHADLLASAGALDLEPPDVVLRFGSLSPSKAVSQWLESCEVPQILINRSRLSDPFGAATHIEAHPRDVIAAGVTVKADPGFLEAWQELDSLAARAIEPILEGTFPSEPLIAALTVRHVPTDSVVYVGSSMPIRDIDTFGGVRSDVTVIGNRGVNGIDGTISSAIGCAVSGVPTTVLVGDVAALHDATALAEAARLGAPLRIVVINNDGGGIFSFLPQHRSGTVSHDLYERHWGTPHGLSLTTIADAMGLAATTVGSAADFSTTLSTPIRPSLIEIGTDRTANLELHDRVREAVRSALGRGQ